MTTYTVLPRQDQAGYDVAIVGIDGARQTILGFKTQADADAWIEGDKRRDRADRPT